MFDLSSTQRQFLRRSAHPLKPVIHIGKQGLTPTVITAVDTALTAHELIKLKFGEFKEEKTGLSSEIAAATNSAVVSIIGNVATLFREHPDRSLRRIILPD